MTQVWRSVLSSLVARQRIQRLRWYVITVACVCPPPPRGGPGGGGGAGDVISQVSIMARYLPQRMLKKRAPAQVRARIA
jgi:hypothetical protein